MKPEGLYLVILDINSGQLIIWSEGLLVLFLLGSAGFFLLRGSLLVKLLLLSVLPILEIIYLYLYPPYRIVGYGIDAGYLVVIEYIFYICWCSSELLL